MTPVSGTNEMCVAQTGVCRLGRRWHAALLTAVAIALVSPLPAVGQTQTPSSAEWTPALLPDGQPDLQGNWTLATYTPLQRPEHLGDQEFFTEEELAELTEIFTAEGVDPLAGGAINIADPEEIRKRLQQNQEGIHYDNSIWLREEVPKSLSSRRTSMIVDPPNGRIPPRTDAAAARAAERTEMRRGRAFDSHETRPLQERCVVWSHEGPPMVPPPYNDILQIVQIPGYVVIHPELGTNRARIIPLDGGPHISPRIRQYRGDSRGRWEGHTLVVETTNFSGNTRFRGSTAALRVVERFTRLDADTISYSFTVDDPATWTSSWTAELPLRRTDAQMYEYACHEGNYDIYNILEVTRKVEAREQASGAR